VQTFCGQEEEGNFSDVDVRTFLCKKHRICRNLWCVHTDKGGGEELNQCGYFADKGSQVFAILCERPLWTAPKYRYVVKLILFLLFQIKFEVCITNYCTVTQKLIY